MGYNLKNYVIGDMTATKLIEILEWTKSVWLYDKDGQFLEQFLAELKCQVE